MKILTASKRTLALSHLLSGAALLVLGMLPVASNAANGTITFNGVLTAPTCTINSGTPSFTVALPSTNTAPLVTAAATTGQTNFNINLSGCGNTPQNVYAFFTGANINATTGNLINTGTATNVEVQLLNGADSSVINLAGASGSQNSTQITTNTSGTGTLSYTARYYSTGGVGATPGTVATTVDYTIVYP